MSCAGGIECVGLLCGQHRMRGAIGQARVGWAGQPDSNGRVGLPLVGGACGWASGIECAGPRLASKDWAGRIAVRARG